MDTPTSSSLNLVQGEPGVVYGLVIDTRSHTALPGLDDTTVTHLPPKRKSPRNVEYEPEAKRQCRGKYNDYLQGNQGVSIKNERGTAPVSGMPPKPDLYVDPDEASLLLLNLVEPVPRENIKPQDPRDLPPLHQTLRQLNFLKQERSSAYHPLSNPKSSISDFPHIPDQPPTLRNSNISYRQASPEKEAQSIRTFSLSPSPDTQQPMRPYKQHQQQHPPPPQLRRSHSPPNSQVKSHVIPTFPPKAPSSPEEDPSKKTVLMNYRQTEYYPQKSKAEKDSTRWISEQGHGGSTKKSLSTYRWTNTVPLEFAQQNNNSNSSQQ